MAYYGVGAGPYIVVPFLGGRNARDVMDLVMYDFVLNPLSYVFHSDFQYGIAASTITHARERNLTFTDHVYKHSTDPYIGIRNAILDNRESNMNYPESFVCPQVVKY
ncbi:MAG: hypothetical protein DGJ47_000855 [Rickettsiaceae bacterium]